MPSNSRFSLRPTRTSTPGEVPLCVFDNPYFNQTWVDYVPPQVVNPSAQVEALGVRLSWGDSIWSDRKYAWDDWGEFYAFLIYRNRALVDTVFFDGGASPQTYMDRKGETGDRYRIHALSKAGLVGNATVVVASRVPSVRPSQFPFVLGRSALEVNPEEVETPTVSAKPPRLWKDLRWPRVPAQPPRRRRAAGT